MSYFLDCNNIPSIEKVSTSRLDYSFDFTEWLAAVDDTIISYVLTAETGVTIDTDMLIGGIITAFISGGTVGRSYLITCEITTADGRIDSRSIKIMVVAAR